MTAEALAHDCVLIENVEYAGIIFNTEKLNNPSFRSKEVYSKIVATIKGLYGSKLSSNIKDYCNNCISHTDTVSIYSTDKAYAKIKLPCCPEILRLHDNHHSCKNIVSNGTMVNGKGRYKCRDCKENFVDKDYEHAFSQWRWENRVLNYWIGCSDENQIFKKTITKFDSDFLTLYKLKEIINRRCENHFAMCDGDYLKLKTELRNKRSDNDRCNIRFLFSNMIENIKEFKHE